MTFSTPLKRIRHIQAAHVTNSRENKAKKVVGKDRKEEVESEISHHEAEAQTEDSIVGYSIRWFDSMILCFDSILLFDQVI